MIAARDEALEKLAPRPPMTDTYESAIYADVHGEEPVSTPPRSWSAGRKRSFVAGYAAAFADTVSHRRGSVSGHMPRWMVYATANTPRYGTWGQGIPHPRRLSPRGALRSGWVS